MNCDRNGSALFVLGDLGRVWARLRRGTGVLAYRVGVSSMVFGALMGCDDGAGPSNAALPSATVTPSASAGASAGSSVKLVVRFDHVTKEVMVPTGERTALVDLMPVAGKNRALWREVSAHGADGEKLRIPRFSQQFQQHDPILFDDAQAGLSLGIFRRIQPAMSERDKQRFREPYKLLKGVTRVSVRTTDKPPENVESLEVAVAGKSFRIADEQMATIAQRWPKPTKGEGPRQDRKRAGWHVLEVVGLVAKAVAVEQVTVVGSDGKSVVLDRATLEAADRLPLLRYNNRGSVSFDLWKTAERKRAGRLRTVVRLAVKTGGR